MIVVPLDEINEGFFVFFGVLGLLSPNDILHIPLNCKHR